jgi:bifunctional UDP-N-acetylglucosamine pyrophosphorylase / glucosamine-1-phosphate N-acetyltransferase
VNYTCVILAAGGGTRMNSEKPKVLHKICGKPMISILVDTLKKNGFNDIIVITGYKEELVKNELGDSVSYVTQKELLGTGHAVLQAKPLLEDKDGNVLILCGDCPLISNETLNDFVKSNEIMDNNSSVLTMDVEDPFSYGRIIKDNTGQVIKIVEEKDANEDQKAVLEVNTGMYCLPVKDLLPALDMISNENRQKEYYLTDVIEILNKNNKQVKAFKIKDNNEAMGINSRKDLAVAEKYLQKRIINEIIASGVTIVDPDLVYIEEDVCIGKDSIVEPFVKISNGAKIGCGCKIESFVNIKENEVVNNNEIRKNI